MTVRNDFAHAWLRIREWARIWNAMRSFTSDTLTADQFWSAFEATLQNDGCAFDPDVDQGEKIAILSQRALVAGILSAGRTLLDPCLLQLSRAMGYPQTDPLAVFPILYRYMATNQGSLQSPPKVTQRGFSRGSFTAGGSNQGNGTVLRMTVDRYGFPLEADAPDVLNLECVSDANAGTNPGAEQLRVTGLPFRDALSRYQAGVNSIGVGNQIEAKNLVGVTGDSTQTLIQNPSLSGFSGTGATSSFALQGWTQASGLAASCSIDTTNYYRRSNVETTPGALKATATVSFTTTIPAGQLNATLAYMLQGACNFSIGSGTGSVRLQVGTAIDVTVSSGVSGWNLIRPTINKNLYYTNFATTSQITVTLTITVSGGTFILVDDLLMQPFQNTAGKLLWAVGGATNWVVGDRGTITDSVPTTNGVPTSGMVQTMLTEVYGKCLPAYAPSTAPSGPACDYGTGGTGAKGAFMVCMTFYNGTTGLESKPSSQVGPITLDGDNHDRILLLLYDTGPAGTTARIFYITQANDYVPTASWSGTPTAPGAFYRVLVVADNVTTGGNINPNLIDLTKPLAFVGDI